MVVSNGQLFKEKTQKIPPKPTVLEVIPENIPGELKAIPNWMCWCYELRQNNQGDWKWTKPPLQVNSHYARSDQPRTWTTFERVWEHYVSPFGTEPNGIGFRPTGDIIGSDLDHCRDPVSGEIDEWAWEIIRLINSYTEISPSGTGIRIFCYGKLPPGRRKNGNVEMYDESSPKYLTITGHHLPGTPRTLERRQTEVERAHAEYLGGETEPNTPEKRQPLTPIEHRLPVPCQAPSPWTTSWRRHPTPPTARSFDASTGARSRVRAIPLNRRRNWRSFRWSPSGPDPTH